MVVSFYDVFPSFVTILWAVDCMIEASLTTSKAALRSMLAIAALFVLFCEIQVCNIMVKCYGSLKASANL